MSAKSQWVRLFPDLAKAIKAETSIEGARDALKVFLAQCENTLGAGRAEESALHHYAAKECVSVLKVLCSRRCETLVAGYSTVQTLMESLRSEGNDPAGEGYWQEMLHLFLGAVGRSGVYEGLRPPKFLALTGRQAGRARNRELNRLADQVEGWIARYPSGLAPDIIRRRVTNRNRVIKVLGGKQSDWNDHDWHLRHIIRDSETLSRIVRLTDDEREGIDGARAHKLPFAITPFYASLMDHAAHRRLDHAVRAQVIPTPDYVRLMKAGRLERAHELDFMGEADTSPIDLVTRRYPRIAIFKPFNTCAQICVYCQRN